MHPRPPSPPNPELWVFWQRINSLMGSKAPALKLTERVPGIPSQRALGGVELGKAGLVTGLNGVPCFLVTQQSD